MSSDESEPTRENVLALYGDAMHAVQQLEEAMAGLVGARRELAFKEQEVLSHEEIEKLERVWEDLFAWSAGRLRSEISLGGQLGDNVERAIRARNLLAHHYLRDHAADLEIGTKRAAMVMHLCDATERFQAVTASLEVERMAAMHDVGLNDDHVTGPGEARRMRYYDPALDDAVAPEPFGDD